VASYCGQNAHVIPTMDVAFDNTDDTAITLDIPFPTIKSVSNLHQVAEYGDVLCTRSGFGE
jgi:hypothetical protein